MHSIHSLPPTTAQLPSQTPAMSLTFGNNQSATPSFGQPQGLFGNPAPQTTAAPALNFGAPAQAQAPSLFGGLGAPTASTSTPSLFGSAPKPLNLAPQPTSLFGQQPQNAPAPSLFGQAPQASTAAPGSLLGFGQPQPQNQQGYYQNPGFAQHSLQPQNTQKPEVTELIQVLESFNRLTAADGPSSIHRTVVFTPRHRVT